MAKINKILVPLDGSKNSFRGLDIAIHIARQCHATLTALCVVPLPPPRIYPQISDLKRHYLKGATYFMNKAKTAAAQKGILLYKKIDYGNEGVQIVKHAQDKKFDLIVIGSRGHAGLKELFLGSTANYVMHKSKLPVLIVK
jgi:nucleotide-binding universal stress UspA family protein